MYQNQRFRDIFHSYLKRGYPCRSVHFMQLGEYSQTESKRFEYASFSGVFSHLSDSGAATVFRMAAAGGNYLVPVATLTAKEARKEEDTLVGWMPKDLLKTVIQYLEDFERVVTSSHDYLQEVADVTRMVNEIGMLRGHFVDSEETRKQLYAGMTRKPHVQTEEKMKLISAHFSGDAKRTFSQLLILYSKLQMKWDLCCPQWKMWQEALDEEWGVDAHTNSPLKNFERIVTHMQTRESEEKAMRS